MGLGGVASLRELEAIVARGSAVVLHFCARSRQGKDVEEVEELLNRLSADTPQATFLRINADEQAEIAHRFGVPEDAAGAPFFVFIQNGEVVDTLQGANPAQMAHKIAKVAGPPSLVRDSLPSSMGMSATPYLVQAVQRGAPPHSSGAGL